MNAGRNNAVGYRGKDEAMFRIYMFGVCIELYAICSIDRC